MYEILSKLLEERGIKLIDIAKATGIPQSTLYDWKAGRYEPKADKRRKIAEYLGVSLEYLDTGKAETDEGKRLAVQIPVYGCIRAGIPLEAIQEILDYEDITADLAQTGKFFALRVKGDSMAPRILEGDVVIVRQQAQIENGDIAIILVNGDEATIKKVVKNEKGVALIPLNPAYAPLVYTREEVATLPVEVIGKVVELRGRV